MFLAMSNIENYKPLVFEMWAYCWMRKYMKNILDIIPVDVSVVSTPDDLCLSGSNANININRMGANKCTKLHKYNDCWEKNWSYIAVTSVWSCKRHKLFNIDKTICSKLAAYTQLTHYENDWQVLYIHVSGDSWILKLVGCSLLSKEKL